MDPTRNSCPEDDDEYVIIHREEASVPHDEDDEGAGTKSSTVSAVFLWQSPKGLACELVPKFQYAGSSSRH